MKKKLLSLLFFLSIAIAAQSQITSVGHRTVTFNDPARTGGYGSGGGTGRQIQTEIYYPSSAPADGDSTAFAAGQFPVLIFGHGFLMAWSSYDNIWKDLVPQGYIVCFPRTEGSASPNHTDFGKDLALLQSKMMGLNALATSPFHNTMLNKTAIMGHSMGGGSSFLACAGNAAPTTMVTFAAANTNPSSIVAAKTVTIPTLVIAGQNDCVAPPPANQDSMYQACAATCKAEITIKGAAHCEFADASTTCSFGEGTCSPAPTITAAQEQKTASVYYSAWLKYWLKNDCASLNTFRDSANNALNIVSKLSCSLTCTITDVPARINPQQIMALPNPAHNTFTLSAERPASFSIQLFDVSGRMASAFTYHETTLEVVDISKLVPGMYFLVIKDKEGISQVSRLIKE
jgi:pimeloyl-ACP methyl ester carboxylesterase